jgi:hypothetical protein
LAASGQQETKQCAFQYRGEAVRQTDFHPAGSSRCKPPPKEADDRLSRSV